MIKCFHIKRGGKMKIQIMGYAASGKSTFAANLGKIYNIQPTYLDTLHWLSDWKERPDAEMTNMLEDVMKKYNWNIEGNYGHICAKRFQECDYLFFFNFNRFTCLKGAIKRYQMCKGKSRESMGDGCIEKLDWEFIRWILIDGRTKNKREKYRQRCNEHQGQTIIFKNHRQVNEYLAKLQKEKNLSPF